MARKRKTKALKRWSPEEDTRLVKIVSEHSGNLHEAFRLFMQEFPERTFTATSLRWYSVLRKREDINTCFITIDRKHRHPNSKNITKSASNKMKVSIWKKILNLLGIK